MSAAASASGRPLPKPFAAAFVYALRVCVPPKRALLLALPCAGAVLFGLLARTIDDPTAAGRFNTITGALFGLILPLASLVVGDAVLGAEVRGGTFGLTWLSPVRFSTIVLARWVAGWVIAVVALVPAMALSALIAGVPEAVGALALETVAGTGAYIALFVFIGATFRRAAWWSLGVVLLGERLLGGVLTGIAQLSPQWLATMVYAGLGPEAENLERSGMPTGWSAVGRLAILAVVFVVLAVRRIRRYKITSVGE
jgi:ABC-type transport system involved in cytochrome c biogenesis permease component